MVDLSRMDAGRLEADIKAVSLAELLESLKIDFDPIAKEKGLELAVIPSTAWVESDPQLLRRLLQNLLSNAIKYTRSGRVAIGARRRRGFVELQVLDTGPGVPPNKQSEIFKEFHRLETDSGGERGLGLGLSIVDRIGRILNHHVGVRSTTDKGSCFFVRLNGAAAPAELAAPVTRALPTGNLNGTHVVCIDNEPDVLDGMRTLLESWHCIVTTGPSAAAALAAHEQQSRPIDVILADYHLDHGATGIDAINEIRRVHGEISAAIITADNSPEVQRHLRDADIPLMRKPVKAAALRALVTQLTRHSIAAE